MDAHQSSALDEAEKKVGIFRVGVEHAIEIDVLIKARQVSVILRKSISLVGVQPFGNDIEKIQ